MAAMPIEKFEAAIKADYARRHVTNAVTWGVDRTFRVWTDIMGVKTTAELEAIDIADRTSKANPYQRERSRNWLTGTSNAILRRGHELGLLKTLPPLPTVNSKGRLPKGDRTNPPSRALFDRLLETLKADDTWEGLRLLVLVMIVALAGIPLRPALAVLVTDVDLAAGVIWIRKTSGWAAPLPRRESQTKRIAIAIPACIIPALRRWLPQTGCEWLFPGLKRKGPWPIPGSWAGSPLGALRAACTRAGIKKGITFESLRRFFKENAETAVPMGRPAPAEHTIQVGAAGEPTTIDGQSVKPLTAPQRAIIEALLNAGEDGLSEGEIRDLTSRGGARNTLVRLKKSDPLWDAIVVLPGIPHGRYRIAAAGVSGKCVGS